MVKTYTWDELEGHLPVNFLPYISSDNYSNYSNEIFLCDGFIYRIWESHNRSIQFRVKAPIKFKYVDFIDFKYELQKTKGEHSVYRNYSKKAFYKLQKNRTAVWNTQINWDTRLEFDFSFSLIQEIKKIDFHNFYLNEDFDLRMRKLHFTQPTNPKIIERTVLKTNEQPTVTLSSDMTEAFHSHNRYIKIQLTALDELIAYYETPKKLQLFRTEDGQLFYLATNTSEPALQALAQLEYGFTNSKNEWITNREGWYESPDAL